MHNPRCICSPSEVLKITKHWAVLLKMLVLSLVVIVTLGANMNQPVKTTSSLMPR